MATGPLQEKAASAEETNRRVRENIARAEVAKKLKAKRAASTNLTHEMDEIDEDKAKQLAEAPMPVEGLSFDESQVLFRGVPFSQASSAEQLRVSVAMAAAGNPDLRIMLIRDGSLLDPDSLKLISEFATDQDYQIWIERVGEGEECQVIIEDGQVKGKKKSAAKGKKKAGEHAPMSEAEATEVIRKVRDRNSPGNVSANPEETDDDS